MSETPTNRTPEVISLPNGTCSVDTGVGRTVFAAPAAAPELLSGERLDQIKTHWFLINHPASTEMEAAKAYHMDVPDLLTHIDAQAAALQAAEARAAEAEAQVAMLRVELEVEQAKTALL